MNVDPPIKIKYKAVFKFFSHKLSRYGAVDVRDDDGVVLAPQEDVALASRRPLVVSLDKELDLVLAEGELQALLKE